MTVVTTSLDRVFTPFNPRMKHRGLSYGKSFAGYDIRIAENLIVLPKGFSLASSMEHFSIPNDCVAMVCDKSTHARRGLSLFNTIAEPGWRGYLTLELFNASDESIEMLSGDPIAQILLLRLDAPSPGYGDGKYQDQRAGSQPAIFETSL